MKSTQDLIITAFGAITSLLTAFLLVWIEKVTDFALYSLMVWFVLPAGALCCGFVAAVGYLAGARLFHIKPRPMLMLNMVGISLGTYFLIHWLQYSDLQIDGEAVADRISFWTYLDYVVSHTGIQFRNHGVKVGDAIELGAMGYVFAALQILGFAAGGFATFGYLSTQAFCDRCVRYYAKKLHLGRKLKATDQLEEVVGQLRPLFAEQKLQEAVQAMAATSSVKGMRGEWFQAGLSVLACTSCKRHRVHFEVAHQHGSNTRQLPELTMVGDTDAFIRTAGLK